MLQCGEGSVDGGEVAGRDGVAADGAGDGVVVEVCGWVAGAVLEDVLAPDAAAVCGLRVLFFVRDD